MKIPYFPGCTLKTTAKNLEIPALEVAKRLDIELIELDRWNCCGVVAYLASDDLMKHLAPVRNFLRVQEMNKAGIVENENRLITLCSMCYNTLSLSNLRMNNSPADLQTMNDFMHEEEEIYDGKVDVVHLLEVINDLGWDAVQKQVKKPLKGLKIAPYYGCMLLRPKEVGIDNPENPQILENLVKSLGAEPVKWNSGMRCCGSYHTVKNVDIVVNLAKGILDDAKANGANAVITTCPLCAFNLDSRQKEIKTKYPDFETIPVLYFSQLMGVAFDIEAEKLAWDLNYVSPKGLF